MAKRKRSSRGGGSSRSSRSKAPKGKSAASAAPVEVVEEKPGEGIDTGILVATFILLLGAMIMTDKYLGQYGDGFIF